MEHQIGLIGCGGIAGTWVEAVDQHPDCRIVLAYDLSEAAAASRAEATGAAVARDLEQIWADDSVDLVIIGTPTTSHPELVQQAAAAGKHIMCEKPMALNLDLCQEMASACAVGGVKLAIGHSLRFWGAFLKCRQLVEAGAIGQPVAGSVDRMGATRVRRADGGGASDHWRGDVRQSGGHALEGFIHELDFARAIFGEVASVSGQVAGGREYDGLLSPELLQALVGFESGALVTLRAGSTVALPSGGCWIGGTEGGLRFSGWGGPVEHYRDGAEVELVECDSTSAYFLELCDLLAAIEKSAEPENSGENGRKNVALGLSIYYSFEAGRRIEFSAGLPVGMPGDYQNTRW